MAGRDWLQNSGRHISMSNSIFGRRGKEGLNDPLPSLEGFAIGSTIVTPGTPFEPLSPGSP